MYGKSEESVVANAAIPLAALQMLSMSIIMK
jgi:hypothetical protein